MSEIGPLTLMDLIPKRVTIIVFSKYTKQFKKLQHFSSNFITFKKILTDDGTDLHVLNSTEIVLFLFLKKCLQLKLTMRFHK